MLKKASKNLNLDELNSHVGSFSLSRDIEFFLGHDICLSLMTRTGISTEDSR